MKVLVYKCTTNSFYRVFFINGNNNYYYVLSSKSVNKKFTRKYLKQTTLSFRFRSGVGKLSFSTFEGHLHKLIQEYDI